MEFGEKLRQARKGRHMTQKALADAIGAKHNSVSNWENGQNHPDTEIIRRLSQALQVEPNYFFDDSDLETTPLAFALYGEVRRLSEEDKQDVLDFIRFKQSLREKRQNE